MMKLIILGSGRLLSPSLYHSLVRKGELAEPRESEGEGSRKQIANSISSPGAVADAAGGGDRACACEDSPDSFGGGEVVTHTNSQKAWRNDAVWGLSLAGVAVGVPLTLLPSSSPLTNLLLHPPLLQLNVHCCRVERIGAWDMGLRAKKSAHSFPCQIGGNDCVESCLGGW